MTQCLEGHGEEQIFQLGSFEDVINSITKKLMVLPEDTIVYPGHRKVYNDKRRRTYIFRTKTKRVLRSEIYE